MKKVSFRDVVKMSRDNGNADERNAPVSPSNLS
jgi:hypothetical protein